MKTIQLWPLALVFGALLCGQTTYHNGASGPGSEQCANLAQRLGIIENTIQAGRYDSAWVYARRTAESAGQSQCWHEWGRAQNYWLEAGYYLGKFSETAAALPRLEKTARAQIHPDSTFWEFYFNLAGAISAEMGNYEEALRLSLAEITFLEKNGNQENLAIACNNAGTYYRNRGDYDRALEYTQAALHIYLTNKSPADLAWTYGNLGKIWYRKKDFAQAIAFAEKALAALNTHFPGENPEDFISIYNDLANAFTETQDFEKALEALKKALRLQEKQGWNDQIPATWHNLGHVYRMMGRYDASAGYLNKAIRHYRPSHPNYGKACRHLGIIAREQGDLHGALRWQQQALRALTDSFPYQDVLANPALQRVNAYQDYLFTLRDKGETLQYLAQKESDSGWLEAALATYDIAAAVLDSMQAEYQEGSRRFWNQEARLILEHAIDIALKLHHNTSRLHFLEKAFQYAEKTKALLLAEALRESAAKQQAGIPDSLLLQEKQLKIDIAFYKKQIFDERLKPDADTARILLWQTEILRCRRAKDALLAKLEKQYPEYYQIKYRHHPINIATIQQSLPTGAGLLEYFRGDQAMYVFYFSKENARGLRISPDSAYHQALDHLLDGLRDRDAVAENGRSAGAISRFAAAAATLYQYLVAPIVSILPAQLLIIPDGRLANLPFELLLTSREQPPGPLSYINLPYVIRQSAVRYEYSAALALQPAAPRRPTRLFEGYAPAYETAHAGSPKRGEPVKCRETKITGFAPLDNNQTEVLQIARLFGGSAYLGREATESQFRRHASEPRVIHLALHGFLNDCDPLYSGMVFSTAAAADTAVPGETDGFLHAYEIYNLRMNAELAVLSACNTGRGEIVKGEGVISLARAFKYAGCANVLMSLWQADDAATAQLMQDFYLALQRGLGKDAAIREAKLRYLDSNPRNHPYFWGAFVLIGDSDPLNKPNTWVWYGLALFLLANGIAVWKRKRYVFFKRKPV